jgi:hypothetical protein
MKGNKLAPLDNMNLLMEIAKLKTKIGELYSENGPSSSDYISLSIKLDLLIKEYIEEKIVQLI